jgi:ABC-type maltose transport system permease subunit
VSRKLGHLPKHAVLVLASLIALFPVYVMVTAAF